MTTMVKCGRCKYWQPPNEFISKTRSVKWCITCREKKKEYHKQNAEKRRKQQKVWREVNAEEIREKRKEYREEHVEEIREKRKEYREEHAEEIREYNKTYCEARKISDPLKFKFKTMILSSIQCDTKYHRPYDQIDYIDEPYLNYLWSNQDQRCYHCGCEMTLDFNATTRNPNQISIQRLNNDLPHIKTNCVLACFACNVNHKERTAV